MLQGQLHLYPAKAMKLMFKLLFSISYYFLLNSRGMRTPHGEDLFMSCISELVLETREVCHLVFPIHFSCLTKNNHSSNLLQLLLDFLSMKLLSKNLCSLLLQFELLLGRLERDGTRKVCVLCISMLSSNQSRQWFSGTIDSFCLCSERFSVCDFSLAALTNSIEIHRGLLSLQQRIQLKRGSLKRL